MLNVLIDPSFRRKGDKLLKKNPAKKARLSRALKRLAADPYYPALATKKYSEQLELWQSYVEHGTPGAWRIWWQWSRDEDDTIIVRSFGPHP